MRGRPGIPDERTTVETSLGVFVAEWSGKGLVGIYFPGRFNARRTLTPALSLEGRGGKARGTELVEDLKQCLQGRPVEWRTPLDFRAATAFQRRVWQAIRTIPYGEVRSYGWLAEAADNARALRAVANACGANPFPLLIPCHRIIASDGSLGGFSGGVAWKKKLLQLERESAERSHEPLKLDTDMPGVWAFTHGQGGLR